MKIALPSRGKAIDDHFGHCEYFTVFTVNDQRQIVSEDVLKSLYQELVDPETRHDLGEVYTPDWLAHRIVNKLLDENPRGALLDPTCGSGTFLYLSIREKRARLRDSAETLRHILDAVCGADIHPLAVIVAKTNYILALGDLLKKRRGEVTIPIFLADTIKLPQYEHETKMVESAGEFVQRLPGYVVELDEREVHLFHKAYSLAFAFVLLLILVANAMIELNDWLHFADRQLAFIGHNWLGVMSSVLLIVLGASVLIVFRKEAE